MMKEQKKNDNYDLAEDVRNSFPNLPDFFAILRFDKMIGVRQALMMDGTGEKCTCLIIPVIKNGIVREGKFHWRLILSAYRMKTSRVPYVTHALAAFLDKAQVKFFKKRRYSIFMPIIGDIVKNIFQIKYIPAQTEDESTHLVDAEKTMEDILKEKKGKTFEEFTGQPYHSYGTNYDRQQARQSIRDSLRRRLFKLNPEEQ